VLDKLRAEALTLIVTTPQSILSTHGPAGVQASSVTCIVCEGCLYILVPSASDHLFNLEHELELVLTSPCWQVRGLALGQGIATRQSGAARCELEALSAKLGTTIVEVFPLRIHLEVDEQRRHRETIDIAFEIRHSQEDYDA
jgi:hypothetical protein